MSAPRLVLIEWVDSRQLTAAWQRVADLNYLSECRCTSVGFLLRDGKDALVREVQHRQKKGVIGFAVPRVPRMLNPTRQRRGVGYEPSRPRWRSLDWGGACALRLY